MCCSRRSKARCLLQPFSELQKPCCTLPLPPNPCLCFYDNCCSPFCRCDCFLRAVCSHCCLNERRLVCERRCCSLHALVLVLLLLPLDHHVSCLRGVKEMCCCFLERTAEHRRGCVWSQPLAHRSFARPCEKWMRDGGSESVSDHVK